MIFKTTDQPKTVNLFTQYPAKENEWGINDKVTEWAMREVMYSLEHYKVHFIQPENWDGVVGFNVFLWDVANDKQFNHFCTQLVFNYK